MLAPSHSRHAGAQPARSTVQRRAVRQTFDGGRVQVNDHGRQVNPDRIRNSAATRSASPRADSRGRASAPTVSSPIPRGITTKPMPVQTRNNRQTTSSGRKLRGTAGCAASGSENEGLQDPSFVDGRMRFSGQSPVASAHKKRDEFQYGRTVLPSAWSETDACETGQRRHAGSVRRGWSRGACNCLRCCRAQHSGWMADAQPAKSGKHQDCAGAGQSAEGPHARRPKHVRRRPANGNRS